MSEQDLQARFQGFPAMIREKVDSALADAKVVLKVIETLKGAGLSMLLVEQNARAAFRIADRGYALGPGGRVSPAGRGAHEAYGLELVEEEIAR